MTRELKFRAWVEQYKKYMPVRTIYYVAISGKIESISVAATGGNHLMLYPDEFILEQHTGLKDKNGKEIYEGDILRKDRVFGTYLLGKVVFCGDAAFRWKGHIFHSGIRGRGGCFLIKRHNDFEVIGNIHENPELCKEEE